MSRVRYDGVLSADLIAIWFSATPSREKDKFPKWLVIIVIKTKKALTGYSPPCRIPSPVFRQRDLLLFHLPRSFQSMSLSNVQSQSFYPLPLISATYSQTLVSFPVPTPSLPLHNSKVPVLSSPIPALSWKNLMLPMTPSKPLSTPQKKTTLLSPLPTPNQFSSMLWIGCLGCLQSSHPLAILPRHSRNLGLCQGR